MHVRPSFREASSCAPFLTVPAFSFSVARPLAGALVETDENRTRICRVQAGGSPVELQPRSFRGHTPRETERPPRIALGSRAWHARVLLLDHGRMVEPPSGLAPEPAVYETAARLLELQGHFSAVARPARDSTFCSSGRIRTFIFPSNSGTPYR